MKLFRKLQLLITDVIMPGMNGKELANYLTSKQPSLKCLFLSGYTADIIGPHGILEEGIHFVQKPFTMDTLAIKIREALTSAI
jgi:FixJ family two-component response regulator